MLQKLQTSVHPILSLHHFFSSHHFILLVKILKKCIENSMENISTDLRVNGLWKTIKEARKNAGGGGKGNLKWTGIPSRRE